jgi:hypothetical protein
MDKQLLSSIEKYEKFRGINGEQREIRELGNGRKQIIYKNQTVIHGPMLLESARCKEKKSCNHVKSNLTLEERKQALKDKYKIK